MKSKLFTLLVFASILSTNVGCSTVSGTVKGFGEDVKLGADKVSSWIKPESTY